MPPDKAAERGARGEEYAAKLLLARGFAVLARNYHSRCGEIDIIASDGETLCFVEVKTRRAGAMVSGGAAVTASKQRKIIRTALCWMRERPDDLQPRFDVCAVTANRAGEPVSHEYLEAAFDGSVYHGL